MVQKTNIGTYMDKGPNERRLSSGANFAWERVGLGVLRVLG